MTQLQVQVRLAMDGEAEVVITDSGWGRPWLGNLCRKRAGLSVAQQPSARTVRRSSKRAGRNMMRRRPFRNCFQL